MGLKIAVEPKDLIKGKLMKTIMTIQGYYEEAKGDEEVKQNYTAGAVSGRMKRIKEALEQDIENLAKDISID